MEDEKKDEELNEEVNIELNEKNDWEYPPDKENLKAEKDYDLFGLYKQAQEELALQQSKRDQIITIYLALCSFLLPFALGEAIIPMRIKGVIFIVLGVIGVLFSYITIRYREYKEVYWLCCQALTVLQNFEEGKMDKQTVQRVFHHCLRKKGKGYLYEKKGNEIINKWLYVRKNTQSAETFYFMIIALMSSFILALGCSLILPEIKYVSIIICAGLALAVWLFLLGSYFSHCIKVYACLEKTNKENDKKVRDKAFNKVFSKAWFLHFYYDEK